MCSDITVHRWLPCRTSDRNRQDQAAKADRSSLRSSWRSSPRPDPSPHLSKAGLPEHWLRRRGLRSPRTRCRMACPSIHTFECVEIHVHGLVRHALVGQMTTFNRVARIDDLVPDAAVLQTSAELL